MCRDISERVATQQNLEIFKRILDRVSDSILAVSADGTLVYANRQFIEEYGVKGELGTQKIYDLPVSLNTKEQFDKRVQEIRDNGGKFCLSCQIYPCGRNKTSCSSGFGLYDSKSGRGNDLVLYTGYNRCYQES